jgi:hypothetical protein
MGVYHSRLHWYQISSKVELGENLSKLGCVQGRRIFLNLAVTATATNKLCFLIICIAVVSLTKKLIVTKEFGVKNLSENAPNASGEAPKKKMGYVSKFLVRGAELKSESK